MCLIYVAWRRHPRYRLVVAANRDEYHSRPALPAHWWDDAPGVTAGRVLAGRDVIAGGTWLGITTGGRFAAITNYRDPSVRRPEAPSRGALVSAFLTEDTSAPDYLGRVLEAGDRYNGFSLLAMDGETLAFASNRSPGVVRLEPGVYGLSNHLLDTPWPKVTDGKVDLEQLVSAPEIAVPNLLELLAVRDHTDAEAHDPDDALRADDAPVCTDPVCTDNDAPRRGRDNEALRADEDAPRTGDEALCADEDALHADNGSGLGPTRWRSSRFIIGDAYGTRTSTVVLLDGAGTGVFVERSFDAGGAALGDATFELGPAGVSHVTRPGQRTRPPTGSTGAGWLQTEGGRR